MAFWGSIWLNTYFVLGLRVSLGALTTLNQQVQPDGHNIALDLGWAILASEYVTLRGFKREKQEMRVLYSVPTK